MIKIIRPGKIKTICCPICNCLFSYEDEDVKRGDQRDYYEVIICPCCLQEINLLEIKRKGGLRNG